MFKNMKIAINEQQPLDEVVRELEKRGYECGYKTQSKPIRINSFADGYYVILGNIGKGDAKLTTLTELKEME